MIHKIAREPIICYDNDANQAGIALLEKVREVMSVSAFTTPRRHGASKSDIDEYIRSFGNKINDAWDAVKSLVAGSQPHHRLYSGTGREFLKREKFIPKWLGEAMMKRHSFRYSAEVLWVYRDGV
jgi:hypothetical protein